MKIVVPTVTPGGKPHRNIDAGQCVRARANERLYLTAVDPHNGTRLLVDLEDGYLVTEPSATNLDVMGFDLVNAMIAIDE